MRESRLTRVLYFVPELAIFVFVAVCVAAVLLKQGSPKALIPTVPIFVAAVLAIAAAVKRRRAACS
ncbi:MAG: hypothetical protein U0610_19695 [bacterium]